MNEPEARAGALHLSQGWTGRERSGKCKVIICSPTETRPLHASSSHSGWFPMAWIVLIVGVFACSTSVIFIRLSAADPVLLSAYRLLLGAAFLAPAAILAARRHPEFRVSWTDKSVLLPGVFLALHFISWIYGARMTPAANATLLVNMTPVVMPLMLLLIAREKITSGEAVGTVLALGGVAVLLYADLHHTAGSVPGDLVCFLSMNLYAVYLAFARRNRAIPSIYLYVVPLYFVAGAVCLAVGLGRVALLGEALFPEEEPLREALLLLGLALVPTVIGHSAVNWAFRQFRGQAVSIVNLGQAVFASLMAALILNELPGWNVYPAAALITLGAAVVVRASRSSI